MDSDRKPEKQRATSPEILANRQTRAAIGEHLKRIGDWQSEAAHIEATAVHDPCSQNLHNRRTALRKKLDEERRQFGELVATLPPKLQGHSRVIDVLRALERLTERLEKSGR